MDRDKSGETKIIQQRTKKIRRDKDNPATNKDNPERNQDYPLADNSRGICREARASLQIPLYFFLINSHTFSESIGRHHDRICIGRKSGNIAVSQLPGQPE